MKKEGGFNRVFEEMLSRQDLEVVHNFRAAHVRRKPDGTFVVTAEDGRQEEFDFLVWSGLMRDLDRAQCDVVTDPDHRKVGVSLQQPPPPPATSSSRPILIPLYRATPTATPVVAWVAAL